MKIVMLIDGKEIPADFYPKKGGFTLHILNGKGDYLEVNSGEFTARKNDQYICSELWNIVKEKEKKRWDVVSIDTICENIELIIKKIIE